MKISLPLAVASLALVNVVPLGAVIAVGDVQEFRVARVNTTSTLVSSTGPGTGAGDGLIGAFDADGASKLVVVASSEHGFNNGFGFINSVTYNGIALTEAVQEPGGQPGAPDRGTTAIFFLDNPGPIGTGLEISAANPNGGMGAAYALYGTQPGVGATASTYDADNTSLTTSVIPSGSIGAGLESLTIASINNSGDLNNGTNFSLVPTADAPLTAGPIGKWDGGGAVFGASTSGRRWGAHASGWQLAAPGTSLNPSFSIPGTTTQDWVLSTVAAEFLAVPEPSRAVLAGLGVLTLLLRRRR